MSEVVFPRLGIVGLGLIGGSLAKALRRTATPPYVQAFTPEPDVARRAVAEQVVDAASADVPAVLLDVDAVVFATPVGVTVSMIGEHRALLERVPVVTDVGSVKLPVVEAACAAGLAARFVGGHPMCGRERSGYQQAAADLFAGATVWLTPSEPSPAAAAVARLWRAVGARPQEIDAQDHDRLVAWASHLPQVFASALGGALAQGGIARAALGPAGRDMTRIAESPPALWVDILLQNRAQLGEPLVAAAARLEALAHAIDGGDAAALERLLAYARAWAEAS